MNAAKQAAWLFCALVALAFSGWYFASAPQKSQLNESALAKIPDTVIHGIKVKQYNEQGQLAHLLEAEELIHTPEEDTNHLKSPHVIVSQENQAPWDIRSKRAVSVHKWKEVTFQKRVVVHQDKDEKAEESTLKTEILVYFPQKKFATTQSKVYFKQPGRTVRAVGMNAYLEEKRVELLNKAHVIYEPENNE